MDKLLPYFERELGMLRRAGQEFAARYPRLAGSLKISGESCADPHVERLIQATAFLNARVAKLLDDGYAGFTEALLGMLYPHFLRPIPSCSIARIDFSGARANQISDISVLPRGTEMKSHGQGAKVCRFRSACDVTIAPVAVSALAFEPYLQAPPALPLPAEAVSAIAITVSSTAPAHGLAWPDLPRLRLFIDGEVSLRAALRDALFLHPASVCVEAQGQWRMMEKSPLAPAGFDDGDALLPSGAAEHGAYRLLSEYFAFPDKFDFLDLDLAAVLAHCPSECRQFTLHLAPHGLRPDSQAAALLRALDSDNLLPGCTPVVNLFGQAATPIRVTHERSSYALMPDEMPASAAEIYSVDAVHMLRKTAQGSAVTEFFPYYSLRHGEDGRLGHYWLLRRDDELAAGGADHEYTLALVDRDFSPLQEEGGIVSARLSCTNRKLPHNLPYGRPGGDLHTEAGAGGFPIRLLRRPSLPQRPAQSGAAQWGLIAQLALNHRTLTQEGLPALRAMLRLYVREDHAVAQRQIDGIIALSQRPVMAWLHRPEGTAYLRGVEVQVTLDEDAYAGTGIHVFAQLLDHLFGLHVHLNSFTQLVLLSQAGGKELLRCPPRNGMLPLA